MSLSGECWLSMYEALGSVPRMGAGRINKKRFIVIYWVWGDTKDKTSTGKCCVLLQLELGLEYAIPCFQKPGWKTPGNNQVRHPGHECGEAGSMEICTRQPPALRTGDHLQSRGIYQVTASVPRKQP